MSAHDHLVAYNQAATIPWGIYVTWLLVIALVVGAVLFATDELPRRRNRADREWQRAAERRARRGAVR